MSTLAIHAVSLCHPLTGGKIGSKYWKFKFSSINALSEKYVFSAKNVYLSSMNRKWMLVGACDSNTWNGNLRN